LALGVLNVAAVMLYAPTFSPAARVSAVAWLVSALSSTTTLPFQVATVRFTRPVRLVAASGSAVSSAP
jgi:hypothetical protein